MSYIEEIPKDVLLIIISKLNYDETLLFFDKVSELEITLIFKSRFPRFYGLYLKVKEDYNYAYKKPIYKNKIATDTKVYLELLNLEKDNGYGFVEKFAIGNGNALVYTHYYDDLIGMILLYKWYPEFYNILRRYPGIKHRFDLYFWTIPSIMKRGDERLKKFILTGDTGELLTNNNIRSISDFSQMFYMIYLEQLDEFGEKLYDLFPYVNDIISETYFWLDFLKRIGSERFLKIINDMPQRNRRWLIFDIMSRLESMATEDIRDFVDEFDISTIQSFIDELSSAGITKFKDLLK